MQTQTEPFPSLKDRWMELEMDTDAETLQTQGIQGHCGIVHLGWCMTNMTFVVASQSSVIVNVTPAVPRFRKVPVDYEKYWT